MRTFFCIAILSIFLVGCRGTLDNLAVSAGGKECKIDTGLVTAAGIFAGGLLGQVIGGDTESTAVGAGLGGALAAFGSTYLKARCTKIAEAIAQMEALEAQAGEVTIRTSRKTASGKVKMQNATGVGVTLRGPTFAIGRSKLTPQAEADIRRMARAFIDPEAGVNTNNKKLLITGHTDEIGSYEENQQLSEARANEVARIFEEVGVNKNSLYIKGAGSSQPISRTDRGANRRVDITEFENEEDLVAYDDAVSKKTKPLAEKKRREARRKAQAARNAPKAGSANKTPEGGKALLDPKDIGGYDQEGNPISKDIDAGKIVKNDDGADGTSKGKKKGLSFGIAGSFNLDLGKWYWGTKGNANDGRKTKTRSTNSDGSPKKTNGQSPYVAKVVNSLGNDIDFGGYKADDFNLNYLASTGAEDKGFLQSFKAYASGDEAVIPTPCYDDEYARDIPIKKFANNKVVKRDIISDYYGGLFGTSWGRNIGGHLVAINQVAIREDGNPDGANPEVLVFADYKGGEAKPDLQSQGFVKIFNGKQRILYQVFLPVEALPLRCMDIVYEKSSQPSAYDGNLFYDKGGETFIRKFTPVVVN